MALLRESANTLYDAIDKFAAFCVQHAGYTRVVSDAPNVIIEKGKVRYRFDTSIVKGTDNAVHPQYDPDTKMFRVYMGYKGGTVEYSKFVPVNLNKYVEPFVGVNFVANKYDQAMILEVGEKVFVHLVIGKVPATTNDGRITDTLEYAQAMTFLSCSRVIPTYGVLWDTNHINATLPFGAGAKWENAYSPGGDYLCSIMRVFDTNTANDFKRTGGQCGEFGTPRFPDSVCMFEPLAPGDTLAMVHRTPNVNTGRTVLAPIRLRRLNASLGYRFFYSGEVETVRYVHTRYIEPGAVLDGEWIVFPCFSRVAHPTNQYPFTPFGLAYNVRDF